MRNKLLVTVALLSLALVAPAQADMIGGIEFDIPEDWTLASANSDDRYEQNIYYFNNEAVIITVHDISDMEELKSACNLMLIGCDDVLSEEDGFYLMSDLSEDDENGLTTNIQECVYYDLDEWHYGFSGARNTGDALLSFIYTAPTIGDTSQMGTFLALMNPYIFEE